MRYIILFAVSIFLSNTSLSQNKKLFDDLLNKYPNNSIVGLSYLKLITLDVIDGKITINEKNEDETILLKDDAAYYEKYPIYSNSFVVTEDIKAKTLFIKGNNYKSVKNENIEVEKDNSSSSFFDDQKKHIVHFTHLEKGAIRAISFNRNYTEPHFFGNDFLCDYYPYESRELKLKCSKQIELEVKFFNDSNYTKKLVVTEDSKYKYYSLKIENIKEYKNFKGSPGVKWYLPHVIYYIKSYNDNGTKKDFLKDVNSLSNWYTSLIKHLPPITDVKLIKIIDSLSSGALEEKDVVKNIFYWVQKNIKYVAFEDGMGGFIPRDATSVFQKRYGDCKDMAFLIYSMLKYKNIKGYLTWIGSREVPYTFTDVPTPLSDDHMIACYKEPNGNYIFLDATDKQIKFGYPSSFTQGKQGLIGTQEQFIDTVFVPIMPYQRNATLDSTYLKIQNMEIVGKCINYFTGYNRVNFINEVSYLSQQKKEEYFKEEFEKGNNKFFISNLKENYAYNDSMAYLAFDFSLKDYFKKHNKEIFINLNIEQNTQMYDLEKVFTTPYNLENKKTLKYVKVLDIPNNYIVSYLPSDYKNVENDYQLTISYKVQGSKIIHSVEIIHNTLIVPQNRIHNWNQFVKEYKSQSKEVIVLKEK